MTVPMSFRQVIEAEIETVLADGEAWSTIVLSDRLDANPHEVLSAIRRLVKSGAIEKVAPGCYRRPR